MPKARADAGDQHRLGRQAFASVALQFPDLAVQQLVDGAKMAQALEARR